MLSPEPHIQKLRPVAHGGRLYDELKELELDPGAVLDFSVSTNPWGPPPGLRQALNEADLESYPDSDSNLLKNRLAARLGISADNLIVGSGSSELIRLAAAAYLGPNERGLVLQPTYGEYESAILLTGAQVVRFELSENNTFRLDPTELQKAVEAARPRAIFLCNPNNPSGEYLSGAVVAHIIESNPDTLVVLDEAYIGFVEKPWLSTALIHHPNLLVIRSMTKDYAMAGIRLGYAFAEAALIAVLNKIKPPWNVSSPAQTAGLYVLDQTTYAEGLPARLAAISLEFKTNLEKLGLRPQPSQANFFLVRVGDAAAVRGALLKKAILVRDCASFGLPQYIRLSIRTGPECQQLIAALAEIGANKYDG